MNCEHCPCPEICLAWSTFCEWAKDGGETKRRTICARSTLAADVEAPPVTSYPPVATQVGNALGAAWRAARTGFKMVDDVEKARRIDICQACPEYDAEQGRCRICGCVAAWKARLESEHCPLPEPKW